MPFRKSRVFFINITAKKDFMNKAYCSCFATSLFQTNFLCVPMTLVFSHQKDAVNLVYSAFHLFRVMSFIKAPLIYPL